MKFPMVFMLFASLAHATWVKEMENENTVSFLGEEEEEERFVEGDIRMTKAEYQEMLTGSHVYGSSRWGRWPNPKKIPYVIHSSLQSVSAAKKGIAAAIDDYSRLLCIRLVPRSTEKNYIKFGNFARGCSSYVGYQRSLVNEISLVRGCWGKGTIMHEIGHALGLWHEQSRPDRDSYVKILTNNIRSDRKNNFKPMYGIDSLGTKYDYYSMMHYGRTAFSKNGRITIKTKDSRYQNIIGQRNGLSTIDIQQIKLMYPALPSKCLPDPYRPRSGKHNYCKGDLIKKWNAVCGKQRDEVEVEDILTSTDEAKRFLKHSRQRRGADESLAEECCEEVCTDHEIWETCPGN